MIEDFRKLEEKLGKETSELLLRILQKQEKMQLEKLATKEDILQLQGEIQRIEGKMEGSMGQLERHMGKLEGRVYQAIGNMAWKMTALLIAQTAAFMGLLKLVGVY
jgi:hypothetical protein